MPSPSAFTSHLASRFILQHGPTLPRTPPLHRQRERLRAAASASIRRNSAVHAAPPSHPPSSSSTSSATRKHPKPPTATTPTTSTLERQQLDHNGNLKKTTTTDAESLTIDGIRVDRVVARNGKPLSAKEAQKESDRIDKEVAKAKERREKLATEGKATDSNGDDILTVSRILELGTFSNPRRVDLNGRPTIVLDYAGDPNAKTRNEI